MCRLLGVVATEPAPIGELVAADIDPFLQLACEHRDGWGVAYRDEFGAVVIDKGIDQADDSERLRGLLKTCVTDMALLHIRMASPNLPVIMANTHPFGDGRAAFAHNGEVRPVTAFDSQISPGLLPTATGDTDSERYFLAVRTRLDRGEAPPAAISATARAVAGTATTRVSLNCMMLTPAGLYAYAEHDPGSEVIGRRGPDYFDLSYRRMDDRVIVASRGWPQPQPQWVRIPDRQVAQVSAGSREIRIF